MYFRFYNIKIYMYYVLKTYMYYERDTGGPWRWLGPMMFMECFWPPTMFFFNEKEIHRFTIISLKNWFLYFYILLTWIYLKCSRLIGNLPGRFLFYIYPSLSMCFAHILTLSFFRLGTSLLYWAVVVKSYSSFHHSLVR